MDAEDKSNQDSTQKHVMDVSSCETRDASLRVSSQLDNTGYDNVNKTHESESNEVIENDNAVPGSASSQKLTVNTKIENDVRPICENGVLDLSRCGLSRINRKFRKEYANVKKLIIRGNMFTNINGFDMFKQCTQVDATDNQIEKLSCFTPFAKQLKVLLLSNNGLTDIECLRHFVNLEVLDVSCNEIETIPSVSDNTHLLRLDLSSNALTSLPDFAKLSSLTYLDVSSNRISSLKTAVFPQCLTVLDISSNNIEDLTEFMRLLHLKRLESISLANNPCVSNPTFDYRVYILSVLPSLQDVDGIVVTEEEQLKGEWLYSQGKGRAFKPDSGEDGSLVKYLEKYCPFNVEGKRVSSLDQSIVKVMEKRREILNSSVLDDDSSLSLSLHSPYGVWAANLHEGKENQKPSSGADGNTLYQLPSTKMPKFSTPARTSSTIPTSVERSESDSRCSTVESMESSSTVTLAPVVTTHQKDLRNYTSVTTSTKCNFSGQSYSSEKSTQLTRNSSPLKESEQPDINKHRHGASPSSVLQNAHGASAMRSKSKKVSADKSTVRRPSSVAVVSDISMDAGSIRNNRKVYFAESDVMRRVACIENHIKTLSTENRNITRINEELSRLLVEMTDKFTKEVDLLKAQLGSFALLHNPDPCNLRVSRELGEGCYEIIWDMPLVKCFKVLTNGIESGVVRAPNNAARISDVETGAELCIQVQAIHFDGSLSRPSNPLIIRRQDNNIL